MKRLLLILMLIPFSAYPQDLLIKNINIIHTKTGEISENQHILIEDGQIKSISSEEIQSSVTVVEGKDKYIIPGLWDMHVHLSMMNDHTFPLFLTNGVTGVRDMGGNWEDLKRWRMEADGDPLMPRIKTAGPILESPRFYGLVKMLLGPDGVSERIPVGNEEQAARAIDSLKTLGVDFVKIRTTQSIEIFQTLAEATRESGLSFTGHIDHHLDILTAIKAGIQSIEHSLFLQALNLSDEDKSKIYNELDQHEIAFCPTLVTNHYGRLMPKNEIYALINDQSNTLDERRRYLPAKLLEQWKIEQKLDALETPMKWDSLNTFFMEFSSELEEHTLLLAGTDVGVKGIFPGWALHEELSLMVKELEISPLKALQSATLNPALFLNMESSYGSVEEGKMADLLILDQNPLVDIDHTQSIHMVIKGGSILDQMKTKEVLESIAEENKNMDYEETKYNHLVGTLEKLQQQKGN